LLFSYEPGVDGRLIAKEFLKVWSGGMDWIEVAHDLDSWRDLVNVVMNFWFP
jgi:hypothetical protein